MQLRDFILPPVLSHVKPFLFFATFFSHHILCPKPWLPFKQHSCFYPSVLLSVLLEIGGLSEKTGPVLFKADRQPNDPGVKGELTTQPLFLHLKPTCLYSYM